MAADVPAAAVRRAVDARAAPPPPVAAAALDRGRRGARGVRRWRSGRPVRPMLAVQRRRRRRGAGQARRRRRWPSTPSSTASGSRCTSTTAEVRVFTRSLDEITDRVPEVVEAVAALPAHDLVLDGEAIALDRRRAGRARSRRPAPAPPPGRRRRRCARRSRSPPYFFDLLHVDGEDLLDAAGRERFARLAAVRAAAARGAAHGHRRPRRGAPAFFADVVARRPRGRRGQGASTRPTTPGRRGAGWVKVKPRHTLDLVVLAVEWGSGRRQGWLSNIHLGARDPETGGFVMLGKTFKGMTDEMLAWQTERFLELEESPVERPRRDRPARAGRRDRLRRHPALHPLPRRAWRCGSPGCCATATTRPPTRPTRSRRCWVFTIRGEVEHAAAKQTPDPGSADEPVPHEDHRAVDRRHRGAGAPAAQASSAPAS